MSSDYYMHQISVQRKQPEPEPEGLPIERIVVKRASKELRIAAQRGGLEGPWVSLCVAQRDSVPARAEDAIYLRVDGARALLEELNKFVSQLEKDPTSGLTARVGES